MERVVVSPDNASFVSHPSAKRFVPWGFNYDHDESGRLIEDYWEKEWERVESDFREMKELGANVVRVHLQFGKFMKTQDTENEVSLKRLENLLALAEKTGLYLDITGLGCYHKQDVPEWYDALSEKERWAAQARFWEAVAKRCAHSPAVFCYDLMNEPVVPGAATHDSWLGPAFAGKHFVQFITLNRGDRERSEVARQWARQMVSAIRKQDADHLITIGLVPWSLDRPGLTSGFVPSKIVGELDFISVHVYPETGKVEEALETLKGFSVGKPVVIEETFPLKCSAPDFKRFLEASKTSTAGWIAFYWGKTMDEYRRSSSGMTDALILAYLECWTSCKP